MAEKQPLLAGQPSSQSAQAPGYPPPSSGPAPGQPQYQGTTGAPAAPAASAAQAGDPMPNGNATAPSLESMEKVSGYENTGFSEGKKTKIDLGISMNEVSLLHRITVHLDSDGQCVG